MKKDRPELWKDYQHMRGSAKKKWNNIWNEDGHFDRIQITKTESKTKLTQDDTAGNWFIGHLNVVGVVVAGYPAPIPRIRSFPSPPILPLRPC